MMEARGKEGAQRKAVRSTVDPKKKIYACKIFDTSGFEENDLQQVFREVKIHSMINSSHCIKHHQTIKTSDKIYMIQEYANCFDLGTLVE